MFANNSVSVRQVSLLFFLFLLPVDVEIAVINQYKTQRDEKGIGFLEVIRWCQEMITGLQVELKQLETDHRRDADQCLVEISAHHKVSAIGEVEPPALVPVTEVVAQHVVFEIVIETHVECVRVRLDEFDACELLFGAQFKHRVFATLQAHIRPEAVEMDLRPGLRLYRHMRNQARLRMRLQCQQ